MNITKIDQQPKKMIKTALIGFCWPCQMQHIREHVAYDKETKTYYCKRTGRDFRKDMIPPISIEMEEEYVNDPTFNNDGQDENIILEKPVSIKSMVPIMLEEVLATVGLLTEDHQKELASWTRQIHKWMDQAQEPTQQTLFERNERNNISRPFLAQPAKSEVRV